MPINPTLAQSEASRQNGAQSAGPNTEAGRRQSSKNATKHGLRAERLELTDDEQNFADELRHSLAGRVLPGDAAERAALEALVICEIKLARLDLLEMRALDEALLEGEVVEKSRLPSLATLDRYRGRIMRERRELESRLEAFKNSRSKLTEQNGMAPDALRYLADLAEAKSAANQDRCTNEPNEPVKAKNIGAAIGAQPSFGAPGQPTSRDQSI